MVTENDIYCGMLVSDGRIEEMYSVKSQVQEFMREHLADRSIEHVDLNGEHVYPCLIDGHVHLLLTIAVMAMGFNACEIKGGGVEPHTLAGVEARVREYASHQKPDAIIAINNYIMSAIDERRMPDKNELDDWGEGRPVVIYNIDGHSTALSSKMLELIGIDPSTSNGVLQGEDNERAQGRIIDTVGSAISLPVLAKGIGKFHNYCAEYGIGIVGALEGNGDSEKDTTTKLIIRLARHFDVGVRLYLQYTDLDRVAPYRKYMKHPRVGGCGDWEMDGASGSHSAAFRTPYIDTGETHDCYYSQEFVNDLCRRADAEGYQIASHAIGELAIERILEGLNGTDSVKAGKGKLHRIEHCEFHDDAGFDELAKCNYAVMMQPGYSWIDKRYLHTYEQVLPQDIRDRMKFKSLYDAGIVLCGSSDSPVQDMDPYMQMLGMIQFYNEEESITPYEALRTYTVNAAKAIEEFDDYGTLEKGKIADFFTAKQDYTVLWPEEAVDFRPTATYYKGKKYIKKEGTVGELARMMLRRPNKI